MRLVDRQRDAELGDVLGDDRRPLAEAEDEDRLHAVDRRVILVSWAVTSVSLGP